MSSTSSSVAATGPIFRPLFTAAQWRELEHQALIYKYLVAGLPVPPDLVFPIRRSFDSVSSRFLHHPSLGYSSYYGKKFDPEPGRCRRTDGKKWRCTKDAYPDSKYCERHMNRGRNRSRKHVESQSTSQSSSTVISHTTTGSSGGSGSFQNLPLHPIVDFEGSFFGNSISKLPMEPVPYGINDKEYSMICIMIPKKCLNKCSVVGRMGEEELGKKWNPELEVEVDERKSWTLIKSALKTKNDANDLETLQDQWRKWSNEDAPKQISVAKNIKITLMNW
ncbi:hypothetical protein F0562_011912 [Nyssa sinensis]|uniref:Growth-regulating factor n=1 Tax=Nyssa sinensis TaxID=561372 RepID=A0A5J4ZVS7_9ASTE|nr:hypothetical protein F0562_011912 [Nyssa sinensis]